MSVGLRWGVVGWLVASAAPGQQPGYTAVVGDDWKGYRDSGALRALPQWFSPDQRRFRVTDHVALVPDPTFGQVARITQPADNDPGTRGGFSPELRQLLPRPLDDVWFRLRVKFSPGWTTAGPYPPGWANSYKLAFILWKGYDGRGEVQFSNTSQYILELGVREAQCRELPLPGSQSFGSVTTEWTGAEWWEFVMHYEKLDRHTFRFQWWRRPLTRGGAIVDNPFTFAGVEQTCEAVPQVRGISLGANKNKATPVTQYVYWGPWEVVDGSRYPNPFNLPRVN